MKSYASVVSNSCSDVFSSKWIQTVVRKVASKEETMKNVIVYGLNETEGEDVRSKVEQVLADIDHEKRVQQYPSNLLLDLQITLPRSLGYQKSSKSAHYRQVQFGLHLPGLHFGGAKSLQTARGPDENEEDLRAWHSLSIKDNKIVNFVRSEPVSSGTTQTFIFSLNFDFMLCHRDEGSYLASRLTL